MTFSISRLGWLPDPPDHRDFGVADARVRRVLGHVLPTTSLAAVGRGTTSGPCGAILVDLRRWCAPVQDQGEVGASTAHAVIGALEYFERKTSGGHVDASRLFLYRVTRRFLGWEGRGDTGAFLRSTMKSLRLFGAVPERYFSYDESNWDAEPEAFHYAYAQSFKAVQYFRLDASVAQMKSVLDAGLPFVFGFTCFDSIFEDAVARSGAIPFPNAADSPVGGHAVLAVGYTESHVLFRNSWGAGWGDGGYGYLPWTYFDEAAPLADDYWVLTNAAWVSEDDSVGDGTKQERFAVRAMSVGPVAPGGREARAARARAMRAEQQGYEPLIKVVRDFDPVQDIPFCFTPAGVSALASTSVPVVASPRPISLCLRSMRLNKSFDWALFGNAVNELYLLAIAWDLSGQPPQVYPSADIAKYAPGTYDAEKGDTIAFVGDGLRLWGPKPVQGALNLRLVVMECDGNTRQIGERLQEVHRVIATSELPGALAALAVAGGIASAGALAAVGAAASVLTLVVAHLLQKDGDDLVAVFEGSYGASGLRVSRVERYDQRGATVELGLEVE